MLVDDFGLATQVLILLAAVVVSLILNPKLNFIGYSENALNIFLIVIRLHETLTAFPDCAMKASL
jgi:hypothetical protein